MLLSAKDKLNSIKVLISKTLIDSDISHNELALICLNILNHPFDVATPQFIKDFSLLSNNVIILHKV